MKIILATDGTKHSESAVEILKNFDLNEDDEVRIVSVVDMAVPMAFDLYSGYLPSTAEIETAVKENAQKVLDITNQRVKEFFSEKNLSVTTEILNGSPESRIVETAEEIHADLIIVGSHGYNRWERLLLGSVSDSVVHHAPCSVLVVRNTSK